ncbi:transcription factor, RsfA family [Caldalkalibacillus thermarum TA2.A1]|uniref:RsfA family transcriptional regulator n=1 Tax=Caldalkalibacillus thermarum (strain TA2.A1) TaxID=986075 RepID=F5L8Y2_CALTT|nr:RsfA family transcriptional regulator [Caldalkalibacillus thermarum]EGL82156.1 transcription factor, RsfA family [Caldalkalibacillus thermarum TA2.A1]QZT33130.1 RsfA family transcriptional regulator [Caldalkalibacillus thermarum TA2.A1]GGK15559.1 transcriptional regulator [Caldalkalibacillus thermarum]
MVAQRQDAWTEEDDLILAEVTLRHIREGSTQLAAFEEVGQRLGRTPAACGFRWNSLVRKKYESAIQIAKAQRNQLKAKKQKRRSAVDNDRVQELSASGTNEELAQETHTSLPQTKQEERALSFDDVIRFLRQQKESYIKMKQVDQLLNQKDEEIKRLREENEQIKQELENIRQEYDTMNEDYQALMRIMERARKLAFLGDEEQDGRISFKMDKNGNLERVE